MICWIGKVSNNKSNDLKFGLSYLTNWGGVFLSILANI